MNESTDQEPSSARHRSAASRILRPITAVVILGFAVHVLLPQVAELEQGLLALGTGRWAFLAVALVGSALTYLAGAWMIRVSVDRPPPWARTTVIEVAASAAAILTPMGVGWVAINQSYLQKQGVPESTARAATGLNMILTVVSHVGLLLVLIPFLPGLQLPTVTPPQRRIFVDVAVAVAVVAGVLVWIPRVRRKTASVVMPIIAAIPDVVSNPRRSVLMLASAAAANLAYGLALYGAVAAFGPAAPPLGILVVYLVAATVAAIAPTPGGLGAMETALIAALTRLAVPGGQAVAATLAFRLATFWLPLACGAVALRRARGRGWM
jgi:undecaprenyl-diphosphatase